MAETFPLLAAQPIYDNTNRFYAVELLFNTI